MSSRSYSDKTRAAEIFLDLLDAITLRGWFNAGPSYHKRDGLLYVSFHIHPGDAEYIYQLISSVLESNYCGIAWSLVRTAQNRFFLCPTNLQLRGEELGDFEAAVDECVKKTPEFMWESAKSLRAVSDEIYRRFDASGRKRFIESEPA